MAIVKVFCKNLKNNPNCPHGPTLKFVRSQNGYEQEFFACSAYRNRKDCRFYFDVGDKLTESLQQVWALEKESVLPSVDHVALENRLSEINHVSTKDRLYCHTCSELDLVGRREQHHNHNTQTGISDFMLTHPTHILKPHETSKKEAQYLFAGSTTQVIVDNLREAEVSRVLCLGTPRIHEHLQAAGHIQSLLLDLDHRHHAFWPMDKFIWYNMFNRHMLSAQKEIPRQALRNFLSGSGKVALVMDPPFGGHVEPLAATVNYFTRLVAKKDQKLLVLWIFPYFRERHIVEKCPSLTMMDYQVQYDNHKEFNNSAKGRKLGSPVRLFTNMDSAKFKLPKSEGYRLCNPCARWVSAENNHCRKCNVCPSKNGRPYVHCDLCGLCVKSQWQHCSTCQRCLPSAHQCSSINERTLDYDNMEPKHKKMKKINMKPNNFKHTKKLKKNIKRII